MEHFLSAACVFAHSQTNEGSEPASSRDLYCRKRGKWCRTGEEEPQQMYQLPFSRCTGIVALGLSGDLRHLSARSAAGMGDTIPVLLDGPYGGLEGDLSIYEYVLLIAGGTGITFVFPVVEELIDKMAFEPNKTVCKSVDIVWSLRSEGEPCLT